MRHALPRCAIKDCDHPGFASVTSDDAVTDLPILCVPHWCELLDSVTQTERFMIDLFGEARVTQARTTQIERALSFAYIDCGARISDGVIAYRTRAVIRAERKRVQHDHQ